MQFSSINKICSTNEKNNTINMNSRLQLNPKFISRRANPRNLTEFTCTHEKFSIYMCYINDSVWI